MNSVEMFQRAVTRGRIVLVDADMDCGFARGVAAQFTLPRGKVLRYGMWWKTRHDLRDHSLHKIAQRWRRKLKRYGERPSSNKP